MWLAKWKWAVAGFAALALTAGGALAALYRSAPDTPALAPVANAEPLFARAAPEPKKEVPKPAWEVATDYLQLVIAGKGDEAQKLGDKLDERYIKELRVAGLKRVRLVAILINESRVMVVTERAWLRRRPDAMEQEDHVTVTLERKDAGSPWRVRSSDVADEGSVWREVDDFLEGKFEFKEAQPKGKRPEEPKTDWDVATEFLKLALDEKTADALKLVVPGTVSENKVGEIKKGGFTGTKPVVVLLNDTRIEVAYDGPAEEKGEVRHLVLMLTKSKDGAWQVKDIDARDAKALEPRVRFYLAGKYDAPAKK